MNKLISIIIVNWNGLRWLKKCLDSLYAQTYQNFEIVFVDNGSQDDSIAFVEKNYPKARIVASKENLGFAGGNNLGIMNSSGLYILLLNNDTWVENDFLKNIFENFKTKKCDVFGVTETKYETFKRRKYRLKIDLFGNQVPFRNNVESLEPFYISGACLFFKKKLYLETGGLDSDFFMYCEEVDWFWRLHLMERKISQSDNMFVHHARSKDFGKKLKPLVFLWRNQNTLQMLLKNYKWFNLLWVLLIYFIQNVFEILFFLFILRPKISLSYIQGWWFNVKNFKKIMQKRKWVQENRKIGDFEIMKKMYIGPGKVVHLLKFLKINI